jgi:hypothetical protein
MIADSEITTFDKKGREIELILDDTETLYKALARYWGRKGALQTPLKTRKKYGKMGGDKRWAIEKN